MSALLTVRIPEIQQAAIERTAAVSGRSHFSLAPAAIGRYIWELAWLEEKVANARSSRDLSEAEVSAMFSALERE